MKRKKAHMAKYFNIVAQIQIVEGIYMEVSYSHILMVKKIYMKLPMHFLS